MNNKIKIKKSRIIKKKIKKILNKTQKIDKN